MSTLTIQLDENAARLVEDAARAANQPVAEWARTSICRAAALTVKGPAPASRVSPLHPDAMHPASDFNAPLDEFAPYLFSERRNHS
jgi:hypothetical protein